MPRAKRASWKTLGLLAYRLALLILWSILALPGVILNAPIFIIASVLSRRKAKGGFFLLLLLPVCSLRVIFIIRGSGCIDSKNCRSRRPGDVESPDFTRCCSNPLRNLCCACNRNCHESKRAEADTVVDTYFDSDRFANNELRCVKIRGGWNGHFEVGGAIELVNLLTNSLHRSLPPLTIALFPGQQKQLDKLKRMRVELSNELTELINELGPQVWEDFDHVSLSFLVSNFRVNRRLHSSAFWSLLQARLRLGRLTSGVGKAVFYWHTPWYATVHTRHSRINGN